jgi:hypothetical protein
VCGGVCRCAETADGSVEQFSCNVRGERVKGTKKPPRGGVVLWESPTPTLTEQPLSKLTSHSYIVRTQRKKLTGCRSYSSKKRRERVERKIDGFLVAAFREDGASLGVLKIALRVVLYFSNTLKSWEKDVASLEMALRDLLLRQHSSTAQMPGKHALSDVESDSGSPGPSSTKRKRTADASSLPRSTPPDEDGSDNASEDEDEEADERDRAAVDELVRTQSSRTQVRLTLLRLLSREVLTLFCSGTRRRSPKPV